MHEGARRVLTGLWLTVILGYPLLLYAHRFQVPWFRGGNDFRSYHTMVLDPLNFGAVRTPFAMQQLTAVIAHVILKSGFVFSNDIAFDHFSVFEGVSYRADVFFSLLLANFLRLVAAGGFVYVTVARATMERNSAGRTDGLALDGVSLPGVSAVGLMLLSGPLMFHVVVPLTEGWSWFLVAAGVYFYRANGRSAYAALLVLPAAVFQRELVPPIFAVLAGAELLSRRRDLAPPRRRFLTALLAASVAAMAAYFVLRASVLPVPRTDLQQISPDPMARHTGGSHRQPGGDGEVCPGSGEDEPDAAVGRCCAAVPAPGPGWLGPPYPWRHRRTGGACRTGEHHGGGGCRRRPLFGPADAAAHRLPLRSVGRERAGRVDPIRNRAGVTGVRVRLSRRWRPGNRFGSGSERRQGWLHKRHRLRYNREQQPSEQR